jgi:hypothetical protein
MAVMLPPGIIINTRLTNKLYEWGKMLKKLTRNKIVPGLSG